MKPLSKEASDALSALQNKDPTAADEARVRQNLERTLGIVIPVASVAVVTTAASAQAATGAGVSGGLRAMSFGAKAVALVVAVGIGTTLVSLSSREGEAAKIQPRPAVTPVQVVLPPAPPPEIEVQPEPVLPEPEPAVVVRAPPRARATPPAPLTVVEVEAPIAAPIVVAAPPPATEATYDLEVETNFPNCDPGTEIRSAQSARKLLDTKRAEEAVWLLGAYQRRCPSGRWSDEAWAVRMAGLCHLGRNAEVTGLLQWFSAEYPSRRAGVVMELRSACPEEVLKHGEPAAE